MDTCIFGNGIVRSYPDNIARKGILRRIPVAHQRQVRGSIGYNQHIGTADECLDVYTAKVGGTCDQIGKDIDRRLFGFWYLDFYPQGKEVVLTHPFSKRKFPGKTMRKIPAQPIQPLERSTF